MSPVFSIIFSAIRRKLYKGFYDSLAAGTNVPFEVVFVGDNPPTKRMPDNFRYIETDVKPAQCVEIAVRNARGKYVLPCADDELFSQNFLNRLYDYTLRLDMDKILITFRYSFGGLARDGQLVFDPDIATSSFVGLAGCYRRDIWNKLGGIDSRWVGCLCDMDMQMRFYEYGMRPFVTPDCIIEELPHQKEEKGRLKLYYRCGNSARDLLLSMWIGKDRNLLKKRLLPIIPFVDRDITTISQGEKTSTGKRGTFTYV